MPVNPPTLFGIPIDFMLFAATLTGVALWHQHVLKVAVTGLATITLYKLLFSPFATGAGVAGLAAHLGHEWVIIANLYLIGFAVLLAVLDWRPEPLRRDQLTQPAAAVAAPAATAASR